MNPRSATCKSCGARILRKSDKMAKGMTVNRWISMAAGGFLIIIAIALAYNEAYLFGGIALGVGAVLILIGKFLG
ncbi:MAG: hypothetical protein OCC46_09585 [Pseudodesulfovibrio sp.]